MLQNVDDKVVHDFGDEWTRFDQSDVPSNDLAALFSRYFAIFPWNRLPKDARGFDLGCGSGRWAVFVAPRVAELVCIEPSEKALEVARMNLSDAANCRFVSAGVDSIPLEDNSMDFGYSLGVLHHVPDTARGIRSCVAKLKPGAPFLLYMYYRFDNRPFWFRAVWKTSGVLRKVLSRSPRPITYGAS